MTIPVQSLAAQASPAGLDNQQNLFEQMAENAKTSMASSPSEFAHHVLDHLDGFLAHSDQFHQQQNLSVVSDAQPAQSSGTPPTQSVHNASPSDAQSAPDGQIGKLIASLGQVFDYTIQTQMVVRGATQVSGSVNTLTKGQ
ncbi:hypothetical protein [Carnimonas bestiolae]|uniref:hypothetical protein n=1 Tax=Carnimonas bestiolae TaxID=3402172 RepID=UPI003EDBE01A